MLETVKDILLAALGSAGIWFGWRLQRRDKAEDRTQRRLEVLRDKAEAIYGEIVSINAASAVAFARTLSAVQQLAKGGPPLDPAPPADTNNLRALLVMYFPESRPIVDQFEAKAEALGVAIRAELESALADQDADRIKGATLMMAAKNNEIIQAFLMEVRSFMDERVKALI